ncbi:MAG TPA: ferrous iron transport protein B [Anaerolineales bacterium]|nr:ferrous iron transport protein B [Anaerolineales bacterium]
MDCHCSSPNSSSLSSSTAIALIGHPNVGKSALFQRLTGQRVIVSNYPGTTVELTRGAAREIPDTLIVDTPGVVTLPPHTEDEFVTARVLLDEPLKAIVQVGDAKNLRRTLLLTVQLAEMGRPLVLALNMMDEADARGVRVDSGRLTGQLAIPVIPTTATRGTGIPELTSALRGVKTPPFRLSYPVEIEHTVTEISLRLPETPIAPRALGLFWLSGDVVTAEWLEKRVEPGVYADLVSLREDLQRSFVEPLSVVIQGVRLRFVQKLVLGVVKEMGSGWRGFSATLGKLAVHPGWGWVILAGVLYALYWFVGIFGAGTLVGLLEENLFGNVINPWVNAWITQHIPISFIVELLVGKYGLWTMGMTYALALILPIVTTFFLAFGVLEDSGYLPRLAALSNRLFQKLGLNGKAVLPMVLGLGCVTMATLTTRVLESKRDRFLVTILLALAIPCSAQLGVVMGMLAGISFTATLIWAGVMASVLLAVGWLAAKVTPGERNALLVELPPMRWPVFSNVVIKTLARLEWYLKEVVPLFLIGAAVMFGLDKLGALNGLSRAMEPLVVRWLGLPAEASAAFLMGFLRRDFGATGLFVMEAQGLLTPLQVVVAMVTVTLFIPCVASVLVIAREHSNRVAAGMVVLIFPLAFVVGGFLYRLLLVIGWGT